MDLMNPMVNQFSDKMVLDLVIMNEEPCMHVAQFVMHHDPENAMPQPLFIYMPPTGNKDMEVIIKCPVCNKLYPEASKRMRDNVVKFKEDLAITDMSEGA